MKWLCIGATLLVFLVWGTQAAIIVGGGLIGCASLYWLLAVLPPWREARARRRFERDMERRRRGIGI